MKMIEFHTSCVGVILEDKEIPNRHIGGQDSCYIQIYEGDIFEVSREMDSPEEWEVPYIFLVDGIEVKTGNYGCSPEFVEYMVV